MRFINFLLVSSALVLATPIKTENVANKIEDRAADPQESDRTVYAYARRNFTCAQVGEVLSDISAQGTLRGAGSQLQVEWRAYDGFRTGFWGNNKVPVINGRATVKAFNEFTVGYNKCIYLLESTFGADVDLKEGRIVKTDTTAPVMSEMCLVNGAYTPAQACSPL
ncbi:hypothetical protein PTTW11_04932 [Pyrenophora teres f. teres]|uniref:Uncharacterized protein n=1 Tax=Pyrenophora teres f. teres TaxID=97479 RepID=A0A6S6W0F0_9PLEO|nr:hypothetical protein PTTW11_04932 [Pyrenophora teres f. teres]